MLWCDGAGLTSYPYRFWPWFDSHFDSVRTSVAGALARLPRRGAMNPKTPRRARAAGKLRDRVHPKKGLFFATSISRLRRSPADLVRNRQ